MDTSLPFFFFLFSFPRVRVHFYTTYVSGRRARHFPWFPIRRHLCSSREYGLLWGIRARQKNSTRGEKFVVEGTSCCILLLPSRHHHTVTLRPSSSSPFQKQEVSYNLHDIMSATGTVSGLANWSGRSVVRGRRVHSDRCRQRTPAGRIHAAAKFLCLRRSHARAHHRS